MTSKYIKKYMKRTPSSSFIAPTKKQARGYILTEDNISRRPKHPVLPKGPRQRAVNVAGRGWFEQIGQQALRAGWHPQMWRRRIWLGPIGEFGDDIILQIKPTDIGLHLLQSGSKVISETNILKLIQRYIYKPLIKFSYAYIGMVRTNDPNGVVPEDSGTLRRTMQKAMTNDGGSNINSLTGKTGFLVVMNTAELRYSKPVNQMPTEWLEHPGIHPPWRMKSRHDGHKLYDPNATSGWYDDVLSKSRNKARILYNNFIAGFTPMISPFAGALGISPNMFANMIFTVRFN